MLLRPPRTPTAIGVILATAAAVGTAVYLTAFKATPEQAPRAALVFALLLSAAVGCSLLTLGALPSLRRINRHSVATAVLYAVCTLLGNIAMALALLDTEPAIVSAVVQVQIFMIALMERVLIKHPISIATMIGAALAVCGFALMQWQTGATDSADLGGISWALVAAASFAIMLVATRFVAARVDMLHVNVIRLWIAVAAMALWPGVVSEALALAPGIWLLCAIAGCSGLVLSRLLLMHAVRFLPATTTKLIHLSTPLFTLALTAAVLGSMPAPRHLLGGGLILIGITCPLLWGWRRRPAPELASRDQ